MGEASVVVITGAASGIGAALAHRLSGPSARLVLHTGRNATALEVVAAKARAEMAPGSWLVSLAFAVPGPE